MYKFVLIVCLSTISFKILQAHPTDSLEVAQWLQQKIKYQKKYSFINYDQNHWEWAKAQVVTPFFEKLKQANKRKIKVLHMGDSHVHFDMQTGQIREGLQAIFGEGGRGFFFPFSAAATHPAYDYLTSHKGRWTHSKITHRSIGHPLGATGISIRTYEPNASFQVSFYFNVVKPSFKKLKIYCKKSAESFNIRVKTNASEETIPLNCNLQDGKPYVEVILPAAPTTIEVILDKTSENQKYFECYGLMLESPDNQGILYNSVGIDGANWSGVLKEDLLASQVKDLQPDLVVLDLGINDFYFKDMFDGASLESKLKQVIQLIRQNSPETLILLTNTQDAYQYQLNISGCEKYAALTRKIAFEQGCALYDYFHVSGGRFSMKKWLGYGLAQFDKIHLTNPGYRIKGELYLNALLNSFYTFLSEKNLKEMIVQRDKPEVVVPNITEEVASVRKPTTTNPIVKKVAYTTPKAPKQIHIVKPNESLGRISLLYGVTIPELQAWNNLNTQTIYVNQKIVVYSHKKITPPAPPVVNKPKVAGKKLVHKVVSGDTLWNLAKQYNTTVEQIKQWNNLADDKLSLGMELIVKS